MKKSSLVIIGANSFQNPLILKAQEKGYETHVFAWQENAIGEYTADFFYPISITKKEEILKKCKEIAPVGIVSIASDLAVPTVNYLAKELNLTGNSMDSCINGTNKFKMRQVFLNSNCPSPQFLVTDTDDINVKKLSYPLIVKPTDRAGSRGVEKIECKEQLHNAIAKSLEVSFEKKAIIEEFIEGKEYSVEYISYKGKHFFLAITEKHTTNAPHFIETGHMIPADLPPDIMDRTKKVVEQALDALGMENGASHTEVKINSSNKNSIVIIETGLRMGGDFIGSDLVSHATGYDYVGMVIDIACGKAPSFIKVSKPGFTLVRFVFDSKDLIFVKKAQQKFPKSVVRYEYEESIADGTIVEDSSMRHGFCIFKTRDVNELLQIKQILFTSDN